MGIFDLFRHDQSEEWPEEREQSLVLDLREQSLNGIQIGAAGEMLEKFGRPSNAKPFKHRQFLYERMGIVIELEKDLVNYFGCPVQRMDTDDVGPCVVTVICPDGAQISIAENTEAESLLAHLPEPADTDVDDLETVYTFGVGQHQLELEVSPDGQIRRLNLFNEAA